MQSPSTKKPASTHAPAGTDSHPTDFAAGVPLSAMAENVPHAGTFGADEVVGVRQGERVFVVGAKCSHYGAPLAKGRVDGERLMCPWHHACFSLRDGATRKAPGLAPLAAYDVEVSGGVARVLRRRPGAPAPAAATGVVPAQVTVLGAGAAGFAAVAELRAQGYRGPIAVFAGETDRPYDRPKLSKAFLSGGVPADKLALDDNFLYALGAATAQPISWNLGQSVRAIDPERRVLRLQNGQEHAYGALIVATGAVAKRPDIAGASLPHVHVLRTQADARALVQAAVGTGKRVLIVGASFIGLEVAAALRQKDVPVAVVSKDSYPMQQVMGRDVAELVYHRHVDHGVQFHLGKPVARIEAGRVVFADGSEAAADVVLLATGVRPASDLCAAAGLACDDGVLVDAELRTSAPEIFAAGDVARYPSPTDGKPLRIEHWAVAQQMGRVAARNVLGQRVPFVEVPFFWTAHYDVSIRYVGHTRTLSHSETFGDLEKGRAAVALYEGERLGAVLSVGCDDISMACEAAMAAGDLPAVRRQLQAL